MAEQGMDLSCHRGTQLTAALALQADLILVMEDQQKAICGGMVPGTRGRIFLLGHWQPSALKEIADPFRESPEAFRMALDAIQLSVESWLPHVIQQQRSA
jgi:protein-tyrosine phosphatase